MMSARSFQITDTQVHSIIPTNPIVKSYMRYSGPADRIAREMRIMIEASPTSDTNRSSRDPPLSVWFIATVCSHHRVTASLFRHNSTHLIIIWCERRDSNSHALRHWYLKPACLPIPPLSQMDKSGTAGTIKGRTCDRMINSHRQLYQLSYVPKILYIVCTL